MHDKDFKVKLISSKNSFLYLSENDSRLLDHDHMIRLSYGINKRAFFSLGTSLGSLPEGELAICSLLAKELGIIRSDIVSLSTTPYIASIRRLKLITTTREDYEILEVLAETVQSTLLNQVKIVHNQQKLVIWITNSIHVTVIVDGVEPISPGKLEMLTEVAILPPQTEETMQNTKYFNNVKRSSMTKQQRGTIMNMYNKTQYMFRLHPIESLETTIDDDKKAFVEQPFNVFLSKYNFALLQQRNQDTGDKDAADTFNSSTLTLVNLRIVSLPPDIKDILNESNEIVESVTARLFCIDIPKDTEKAEKTETLYVHKLIFDHFNAKFGCKVLVEPVRQASACFIPKSIDIVTHSKYFNKADELVRNYLCQYCQNGNKMLVNSNLAMEDSTGCRFLLKFNPANEKFLIIDDNIMRDCKFKLADLELVEEAKSDNGKKSDKPIDLCLDCCNYKEIVDEIGTMLIENNNSVMLTGKIGSGKTSLIKKINEKLSDGPHYIHVEHVACRKLKGKNIESLLKTLNGIFLKLIYYQPSLLILDDVHVICEKVIEGEQPTQENLHFNKVSDMLSEELEHLLQHNEISLLATSESMGKLNQNIYDSRGKHLFKNCFSINEMNKEDRIKVLKHLFQKKEATFKQLDFDQLGIKTEGYIIQDLHDLVDKIIFEVYKDSNDLPLENELIIKQQQCEVALTNTSTLSLRQVQLHSPGDRDFSDIGGLDDVKKILVETMLWPAQYANIFSRSPLRLQSGVLLYGPPGTGKTILAGAAAKQCNLRLISVKGPELLSKYIGASEQAVRDIFQKAQSAKPCILFFDEFDSLAPRRGHDNTGVTDRVVNQFLTQLDGVESLSGVCVLAATSRPDLLDPALLRPGRLDRQILCPMPDKQSRLAILNSLSKKLNLTKEIKLEKFAEATQGFSGADLQAVLYTAQLNSVEYLLQDETAGKESCENQTITQKHLDDAMKSTRPSLTRDERAKYERIYQRFQGNSDMLESLKSGKQKTTLA